MEDYAQQADPSAGAEPPEIDESRKTLVEEWCAKIKAAREKRNETFKAMRESQDFAHRGSTKEWKAAGNYTVPILPRYINQAVSTLYARNPNTVFERRKRLRYRLWDGRADSLQAAMEMVQMGDTTQLPLLEEVMAIRREETMLDKMGETLSLAWQYYLDEQAANYKQQLKAAVRRAKVCKVAWIKLGYQRALEPRPEVTAKINDVTSKISAIEETLARVAEDKVEDTESELEQLRLNLADLQRDEMLIVREGPVLDFPRSDQMIVDTACVHLKSLSGARWVAQEYEDPPDQIKKIYGHDVRSTFKAYAASGKPYRGNKDSREDQNARYWEVYDKVNQQCFVICEGYPDFLKEPATPDVWMERFWPWFPIVFNETEHYEEIYPLSDVEQAKDIQEEYNRSREALRQHRIAAQPWWVEGAGLSDDEKSKIANHGAHGVVSMTTLGTGQKIGDILQAGPTAPVDMNLYEAETHFGDLMRTVGYQEAQIGATSGSTATESSIAQQSQSVSQSDNIDDLDETLSELARAAGQVMLLNCTKETIMEIVGEGAVWPDAPTTREAAAKEIMLKAEAGSTGRPNKAAELANMERAVPMLQNMPEVNPKPVAKKYLSLLDIDVEEGIAEGLPSVTAINAIISRMAAGGAGGAQPTGDPRTDPNSQGGTGAQNAPNPQVNEPGPQPAYTPPA